MHFPIFRRGRAVTPGKLGVDVFELWWLADCTFSLSRPLASDLSQEEELKLPLARG